MAKMLQLIALSLLVFYLGRFYEARIRLPEEIGNILSAYRDGKSECKNKAKE